MRHYYAQIDNAGVCTAVLDTHAPIDAPHMIPIDEPRSDYIGRTYAGGAWSD